MAIEAANVERVHFGEFGLEMGSGAVRNLTMFLATLFAIGNSGLANAQTWHKVDDQLLALSFSTPDDNKVSDEPQGGVSTRAYFVRDTFGSGPKFSVTITYLNQNQSWKTSADELVASTIASHDDQQRPVTSKKVVKFRGFPAARFEVDETGNGGPVHHYFVVVHDKQLIEMWTSSSDIADRFFNSLKFD